MICVSPTAFSPIDGLPDFCTNVIQKLDQQPFRKVGEDRVKIKVLEFYTLADLQICRIFCENASCRIEESNKWSVSFFGNKNGLFEHPRCYGPGDKNYGATVRFYQNGVIDSADTLNIVFQCVLDELRANWFEMDPIGFPSIGHDRDPKKYTLYIKWMVLDEEDTLVRFIASRLGFNETEVYCDRYWTRAPHFCKTMYLWIEDTSLESVTRKIGFVFRQSFEMK